MRQQIFHHGFCQFFALRCEEIIVLVNTENAVLGSLFAVEYTRIVPNEFIYIAAAFRAFTDRNSLYSSRLSDGSMRPVLFGFNDSLDFLRNAADYLIGAGGAVLYCGKL